MPTKQQEPTTAQPTKPFEARLAEWRAAQPEYRAMIDAIKTGAPRAEILQLSRGINMPVGDAIALIELSASARNDTEFVAQAAMLLAEYESAKSDLADLHERRLDATTDRERIALDQQIDEAERRVNIGRDSAARARNALDREAAARSLGLL